MRIKGLGIRHVQRPILGETQRQIGIGDEELPEGNRIRLALREQLLRRLLRQLLVRNIDAAKSLLQLRPQSRFIE